jgi:regulator of RNase E activity RraA
LCARMKQRSVAGLISDGAVRDMAGVLKTGLSVWAGAQPLLPRWPVSPLSIGRSRSAAAG